MLLTKQDLGKYRGKVQPGVWVWHFLRPGRKVREIALAWIDLVILDVKKVEWPEQCTPERFEEYEEKGARVRWDEKAGTFSVQVGAPVPRLSVVFAVKRTGCERMKPVRGEPVVVEDYKMRGEHKVTLRPFVGARGSRVYWRGESYRRVEAATGAKVEDMDWRLHEGMVLGYLHKRLRVVASVLPAAALEGVA